MTDYWSQVLLKSYTVIIERGLVVIERSSIRPKFGDVHGREVKDLSELALALSDFLFRLTLFGDIRRGPEKLYDVARLVQDRMADSVEVLDGSITRNNAIVRFIISFLDSSSFIDLLNYGPVLRMNPVKEEFSPRRVVIGLDAAYSKYLR